MILRTLSLLRSLQGARQNAQVASDTVQRAGDYRWLCGRLPGGVVGKSRASLADGTPAIAITLAFPATPERRHGGRWPEDPEAREAAFVEGADACRAAGAPRYRTLEGLSRGVAEGAISVLRDAARFQYLEDHQALRLVWRRPGSLAQGTAEVLARRLGDDGLRHGLFLLEVRVPGQADPTPPLDGDWLDARLDRYRRIRSMPTP
jgi:hypothetical protein